MKRTSFLAVGLLLLTTSAVMAHHGTAGYNMTNMTSFEKATITEIEWANPHCQIRFDAMSDKGELEHGPSRLLLRACWRRESGPESHCKRATWS